MSPAFFGVVRGNVQKCKKEREWKAGMTKKSIPAYFKLKAKYLYY